jgi:hypothetical protein
LERLLQAVTPECKGREASIGTAANRIEFRVQISANGVIFSSKEANGMRSMREVLGRFNDWPNMQVNVKKSATSSNFNDTS